MVAQKKVKTRKLNLKKKGGSNQDPWSVMESTGRRDPSAFAVGSPPSAGIPWA